ncbi:MAG: aminopeptidase [Cytophagaceae bacterium]
MAKKKSTLRKILYGVLVVSALLAAIYHQSILYGISQGYGQVSILMKARPIEEFLDDPNYPDSLKANIRLVQEIREFAFDSLGLNRNDNYTTLFDQGGKPILWIVTGSDPYNLKAREWSFPFLGSFSYKGFFDFKKAEKEEGKLKAEGLDTSIGEVEGWSTLGWFKDPILSNMLHRRPGSLANLIIHELTHGTLYIKNDVDYNENLASFVGDKGALIFLRQKYGEDSPEYRQYEEGKIMLEEYTKKVLINGDRLDSLYNTFSNEMPLKDKGKLKKVVLKEIQLDLQNFFDQYKNVNPRFYHRIENLNNTYFLDYRRYREKQDVFEEEFREKFNSDFKAYMLYLKETYPSL